MSSAGGMVGEVVETENRTWRERLYRVIFEHDTPAGRAFDVVLLVAIVVSVLSVMLESVWEVRKSYGNELLVAEWVVTVLFTAEYLLRIFAARRRLAYVTSFLGLVDLLAIVPTYLSIFVPGSQALLTVRALRLLRVFRILKLGKFVEEADYLGRAMRSSSRKILVFLGAILTVTIIMGALMYLIEGPEHGFTSIPKSVYWAIVTMTTVGYGDITPLTVPGQLAASTLMIAGYAIIAVPTGIVTAEMVQGRKPTRLCLACNALGHDADARFCRICGASLPARETLRASSQPLL